jgi:DNA-binding NarL/FixJ family response regulator
MGLKILVADDHAGLRAALRALISLEPDLELVGDADGGVAAVRLARELKPGVILMDLSMPDLNGIDATRQVRADAPEAKVIALSAHLDRRLLKRAWDAGAAGYVLKDTAHDELIPAIRAVAAGERYVSPRVAREHG